MVVREGIQNPLDARSPDRDADKVLCQRREVGICVGRFGPGRTPRGGGHSAARSRSRQASSARLQDFPS